MQRSAMRRAFTYLLAALAGVAGALLGWVIVGLLADFLLGLGGMSDREGGRAMVAFFTYGLFGGLAGLIIGIWLVLRYFGGYTGFARLAGRGALVVAGTAAALGLGLWAYLLSDDILARNGPPPQLKFELRLPPGTAVPDGLEGVSMDANTDKNTMPALLTDNGIEDGRPSIAGLVDLYFRTRSRLLVLRMQHARRARPPVRAQARRQPAGLRRIRGVAACGPHRRPARRRAAHGRTGRRLRDQIPRRASELRPVTLSRTWTEVQLTPARDPL